MPLESPAYEKTHPDIDETAKRVFYTLLQPEHLAAVDTSPHARTLNRTAKLIGLLVAKLEAEGRLSEDEINDILLQTVL